ncbi:MAG: exo-alpha-sialidase, partial [Pirellulaceae bacterium]
ATERELMPQRGAKLGNFGVTEINEHETWVTDAEWMQTNGPNYADYTECMKYGSDNAVFAARIQWATPNRSWSQR